MDGPDTPGIQDDSNRAASAAAWSSQFALLPSDSEIGFANAVRQIIDTTQAPRPILQSIVDDNTQSLKVRFTAFYGMLVDSWRAYDYTEFRDLVDKYEYTFGYFPLFHAFRSQYYGSKGDNQDDLRVAVAHATKAIRATPDLPNVLHQYAETVARLGELNQGLAHRELINAERQVARAIALDGGHYAKYFATRSRLQGLDGRFAEARASIDRAIDLEPSTGPQYPIRIAQYQDIRTRLNFYQHTTDLRREQDDVLRRIADVQSQFVGLLGILAAAITIVIAGANVALNAPARDAALLLLMVSGCVLTVFAGFSFLFYQHRTKYSQLFVLVLGVALMAGSALIAQ